MLSTHWLGEPGNIWYKVVGGGFVKSLLTKALPVAKRNAANPRMIVLFMTLAAFIVLKSSKNFSGLEE